MERLRAKVEELFMNAPRTKRANDLKEELLANLIDKYNDLINSGKSEDEAFNIVVAGIGDVDELIRGLRQSDVFDYSRQQEERKKSALVVSISVGLYILSIVAVILINEVLMLPENIGACVMLTIDAVATGILIYHFMSRPKYVKSDDTIVEDFKEWKSKNTQDFRVYRSIKSIIWTVVVIVYLLISFLFGIWYISWIIFIIGAVIEQIVKLIFELKE